MRLEKRGADEIAADEGVGLVDTADPQSRRAGLREQDRDRVPGRQVLDWPWSESMSRSPLARAPRCRMSCAGSRCRPGARWAALQRLRSDPWYFELSLVVGRFSGDARHRGRDRGDERAESAGPLPVAVRMRSALIAWSTLLVADLDSDAPNTAIADTRASPTISAEAVCAVRLGLRMEFSRPSFPGSPRSPGERTADHAGHRPRDRRGEHGDPDEQQDRAGARRAGSPAGSGQRPAGRRRRR